MVNELKGVRPAALKPRHANSCSEGVWEYVSRV